jgi:hypothetical protein
MSTRCGPFLISGGIELGCERQTHRRDTIFFPLNAVIEAWCRHRSAMPAPLLMSLGRAALSFQRIHRKNTVGSRFAILEFPFLNQLLGLVKGGQQTMSIRFYCRG